MNKLFFDVAVVGGGSAGMAAALKANEEGTCVAIVEREAVLGGILNQCIHNGFGLSYFKQELTGPEYAKKFENLVLNSNIKVFLGTTVTKIGFNEKTKLYALQTISASGVTNIFAKAIVLAMGCRERPSAAISLAGSRPAGVITAGSAQKLVNCYGKMVGKNIVIVGSGDIGLIMARRLRYEGAKVLGVYEILSFPSGLKRNISQCLTDYNIPLHLSKTVFEVVGENRVEGVWVAPVKQDMSFDFDKKEFIPCDCVVLSVGLVPEEDLAEEFGIKPNNVTGGAIVDEFLQTSNDGVFSCGNVLHVHDIVDNVTREAERAGKNAALFAKNLLIKHRKHEIRAGNGVRYVNPCFFYEKEPEFININFRVSKIFNNAKIVVKCGNDVIKTLEKKIILPAEMETVVIPKKGLNNSISVEIEWKIGGFVYGNNLHNVPSWLHAENN